MKSKYEDEDEDDDGNVYSSSRNIIVEVENNEIKSIKYESLRSPYEWIATN